MTFHVHELVKQFGEQRGSESGMSDPLTARVAKEWRAARAEAEPIPSSHPIPRGARQRPRYAPAYQREIRVLDGEELLTSQFPPRNTMMSPWLPDKGLAMIYAERGIGKTWIALSIAHAIAAGGEFLSWTAARPRKVLYLDGEMPAQTLQERYAAVVKASMRDAPRENFRLAAADCQPDGLPDLASEEAQRFYDAVIADAELIICDNLSTLAHGLRENEADSFGPVQSWMLAQRRPGVRSCSSITPAKAEVSAAPLEKGTHSIPHLSERAARIFGCRGRTFRSSIYQVSGFLGARR